MQRQYEADKEAALRSRDEAHKHQLAAAERHCRTGPKEAAQRQLTEMQLRVSQCSKVIAHPDSCRQHTALQADRDALALRLSAHNSQLDRRQRVLQLESRYIGLHQELGDCLAAGRDSNAPRQRKMHELDNFEVVRELSSGVGAVSMVLQCRVRSRAVAQLTEFVVVKLIRWRAISLQRCARTNNSFWTEITE
jgi:hypothetical protein